MKLRMLLVFIAILALAPAAFATVSANATLQVTGTVASSVSVTLSTGTGGATLSGGAIDLGTFGRASTVTNWTKNTASSSYSFSTPVHVLIDAANTTSGSATVTAYLSTDPGTVTFSFGGTSVASFNPASPTTIAGTTYTLDGTTKDYSSDNTVQVSIPDALAAGAITNTINLTVTVN